jgi:hypothetical protein
LSEDLSDRPQPPLGGIADDLIPECVARPALPAWRSLDPKREFSIRPTTNSELFAIWIIDAPLFGIH